MTKEELEKKYQEELELYNKIKNGSKNTKNYVLGRLTVYKEIIDHMSKDVAKKVLINETN